jgi:hypothetical protein
VRGAKKKKKKKKKNRFTFPAIASAVMLNKPHKAATKTNKKTKIQ